MLIPGISQLDAHTPFGGRPTTAARAKRPTTSPPAQPPAEPAEPAVGDDGAADDQAASDPQQAMTLAAAQAAYASN